jgi:hypothetical protein
MSVYSFPPLLPSLPLLPTPLPPSLIRPFLPSTSTENAIVMETYSFMWQSKEVSSPSIHPSLSNQSLSISLTAKT